MKKKMKQSSETYGTIPKGLIEESPVIGVLKEEGERANDRKNI